MNTEEIEKLFRIINKRSPENSIWYSSINLTNAYFTYFFNGTECESLKKEYAKHIFIYILEYLNKGVKKNLFHIKLLENFLFETRKITFNFRQKLLYHWINCVIEKKNHKNNIVQYLCNFYPNISMIKKVKEQLGLNYTID